MNKLANLLLPFVALYSYGQETPSDSINKIKEIQAIEILVKKKLVERKIDRLVFNINNSSMNLGNNLFDALQEVPMIKADENSGVSITGKSSVSILINDKIIHLSSTELINYLKSLSSKDIDKIEVITTPPAKYEAQGNSGLINIVMKKNKTQGFKGSYRTSLISRTWNSFDNNLNLSYRKNKLSTNLKLKYNDFRKKATEKFNIVGNTSSYNESSRIDFGDSKGVSLDIQYGITDKSTIGLNSDFSFSKSNMDINDITDYFTQQNYNQTLKTYIENRSKSTSITLSGYYDLTFGKQDNKLSIIANYFNYDPTTNVDFITTSPMDRHLVKTYSGVNYKVFSGQFDFTFPTSFGTWETGAKYSSIKNSSNVKYSNYDNTLQTFIPDISRANLYNYNEENYATYITGTKEFEKFSIKAGLRYEHSIINGLSITLNQTERSQYGKLFPTLYLEYTPNENNNLSLSYSKRINRPRFRAIDPFRWYSNPYSYTSGNPKLKPSYNHNIEFNYTYKNALVVNAYFQRMIDGFDQISELNGMYEVSTFKNFFNENNIGMDISYNAFLLKWWQGQYTTFISYSKSTVDDSSFIPQKGFSIGYSVKNSFRLNSDKTSYLTFTYNHFFPSVSGNTYYFENSIFNIGYTQSLLTNKLQLSLNINDIFKQKKFRGKIYFSNNTQFFNNYYDTRSIILSAVYNFGASKSEHKSKQVNFEEKNRTN